jgi:cytochrome bd-type quinol oxidase subunit 2
MIQKLTESISLNKLTIIIAGSLLLGLATFYSFIPLASAADPKIQSSTCQGAELEFSDTANPSGDCAFAGDDPQGKVNDLIAQIINIFSVIVGVVAVIMIIVGGFRYITSGGDSGNVTTAKNTILYAIVGLVIVALAQFIVKFVLSKATTGAGAS